MPASLPSIQAASVANCLKLFSTYQRNDDAASSYARSVVAAQYTIVLTPARGFSTPVTGFASFRPCRYSERRSARSASGCATVNDSSPRPASPAR